MEQEKTTNPGSYSKRLHNARQRLAVNLSEKSSLLSTRQLRYWFMAIVTILGLLCGLLLLRGICGRAGILSSGQGITAPVLPVNGGQVESRKPFDGGYKAVIQLREYLDSLKNNTDTKQQYDELLQKRPQLLDSLELIESYYQSKMIQYGKEK